MGTPLTGASNAGGVGKKRDSERISLHTLHTAPQCCKPYESRNVKNKAETDGVEPSTHGGVRRSLFSQDDVEVFVTGSTLYAGDAGQPFPPDTNPLVITPFSAAVKHRRTEPGGYFCRKLTLTHTDPIRPTRQGPDPNRPTNGRKQGVMT